MKNILLVLLSLIMIVSCSNPEVVTTDETAKVPTVPKTAEVRTVNGVVIKEGLAYAYLDSITYTGKLVSYYVSGSLKETSNYKDGERDGLFEYYYENGQLAFRIIYKDGKPDGLSETYQENGQLRTRNTYKDGELEGLFEMFEQDGTLVSKCFYVNGKKGNCE